MSLAQNSMTIAYNQKAYKLTKADTYARACQKRLQKADWLTLAQKSFQWKPQELVTLAPKARRNAPGTKMLIAKQGSGRLGVQLS